MLEKWPLQILLLTFLTGLLGLEREAKRKPAGIGTHILVALSVFTFFYIGEKFVGDLPRIISSVIIGIGFIGGGVIVKHPEKIGEEVIGITTAATLWFAVAISLLVCVEEYLLAMVLTLLALGVLKARIPLKEKLHH